MWEWPAAVPLTAAPVPSKADLRMSLLFMAVFPMRRAATSYIVSRTVGPDWRGGVSGITARWNYPP